MEVRHLQAGRSGVEATLRMDTRGARDAAESGVGKEARVDGSVSDISSVGAEPDVD